MKYITLLICLLWISTAWGQNWTQGTVTQSAWLDTGGFQIVIDDTQYTFMNDAVIIIDSKEHPVPNRMHQLVKNTRVRIFAEGFRIYQIEVMWRYPS
jgi:hypothetical protein